MKVTPPRPDAHADTDGTVVVPAARTADTSELTPVSGGFLAKATLITAALSIVGALLGLVRDQALARLFGAGSETDAFLVAWTVPEFASTLFIEDGLAFALIPAFSLALARRAQGAPGDPVRSLVAATLPWLSLAFVGVSAVVIGAAPYVVGALAPGLPDPGLAVDCTRLTALSVLGFGLAGYCSAALRAHRTFLAPAAIYVAYNAGIITAMFVLGGQWGVRSAAAGVAVGGGLMVAIQLPSVWRQSRRRAAPRIASAEAPGQSMTLAMVATVLLFALCRQSQVLIERFLASALPAGAISHLNYAQKVAQIPMTLSLMLCTVTFPVVARALADGDTERARDRVERDLALAACLVLLGAATVIACAPRWSNSSSSAASSPRRTRRRPRGSCACTPSGCSVRPWSGAWSGPTSRRAAPPGTRSARWPPASSPPPASAPGRWARGEWPGSPPRTPSASPSRPWCCWPAWARATSRSAPGWFSADSAGRCARRSSQPSPARSRRADSTRRYRVWPRVP